MRLRQLVFAMSLGICLNNAVRAEPPPDARARDRAGTLLSAGNDRLNRGLWVEALKLLAEAYRTYPSPKLHFNIVQPAAPAADCAGPAHRSCCMVWG